ncbi:TIGR01777 family oxidoreductase [Streptomyces sp. NPDC051214]|uniref:TIGR01777 family oxidoreductase n=1 Tax=Streptomyces sp. NPDC051214 TaxID=3155282 RepID=UPI0034152F8A
MKVVLAGGTGQVGAVLERAMTAAGHEVVVLTRHPRRERQVGWDGRTLGSWTAEIDGSDVVVNLAGRSVSCRYTEANLRDMMDSRVRSAEVVGAAIAASAKPPALWLQMSTATIYAHRHDAPHDEATGVIGGTETGVPDYWEYSVRIAKNWERAQQDADTPHTRKVALRAAMVMSPDRGGVFDVLLRMTRLGLGGPVAGGAQYLSWIHDEDFVRAVEFLIARDDITGPVNLSAPGPLPHRAFMRALRAAAGVRVGLPATKWMAEIGAFVIRTDTELLLKSRRVIPGRLLEEGFVFEHAAWPDAATDLLRRRARDRAER